MDALLGIDLIDFFPQFELIKCMSGSAFKLKNGSIIPFGNVTNFLVHNQVKNYNPASITQQPSLISQNQMEVNHTLVNAVLNPVHSYFSPLSHFLEESA